MVCFIFISFVFTTPASAEILKLTEKTKVVYCSQYTHIIEEKNGQKYIMFINFEKNKTISDNPFFLFSMYTGTTNYVSHDNFNPLIIFSLKTPPKFEITPNTPKVSNLFEDSKNSTNPHIKTFNLPTKNTFIEPHGIIHEFTSKIPADFSKAEKIVIIMPCSDGTELRIELPEEIAKEWHDVYTVDLHK